MLYLPIIATFAATVSAVNNNREYTTIKPAKQHHDHKNARDAVGTVIEYYNKAGEVIATSFIEEAATVAADDVVNMDNVAAATATASAGNVVNMDNVAAATTTSESSATAEATTSSSSSSSSDDSTTSSGTSSSFTDGTIKCTDFDTLAEQAGVVSVDWIGLGGYASIMSMDGDTSTTCESGYYCSYACEAGQSKTQWPSSQPSDGRTVGGLYCGTDGYLYKTNSDYDSLCVSGENTAYFKSEIDQDVALCRTDYPGSENMVVPTLLSSQSSAPVSVVDEESYFQWEGKPTSAQYYVNNAGVSVEDGCIWSTSGTTVGNWAPLVIGAGSLNGVTYLSLIPNPNNEAGTNYNVKFVARDGASTVGECSYIDNVYTGGSGSDGCTFTVTSGIVDIVFY
ncbi:related to Protein NCA3, mitochondrial [Hanseniaspora guilliermondii]|uniref:Related to Protein NCA3, mitochondrial n=1 Tax=Hanseniaspora guilliermondii TaxID=56406 RepID=A0A1L0B295_9ASCO|nr:related to Protein NCA3, mitochondrial [Hanseniaspora guilliermondii]